MYQQRTIPVLIWSNLILNFEILRKSKIKLLQINIPSDVSNTIPMILKGDHEESLRSKNLEYFIVLFYFMTSVLFIVYFNKLIFFHLNYQYFKLSD